MRLRHLHPAPLIGLLLILATGWAEYRTATTDHPAHAGGVFRADRGAQGGHFCELLCCHCVTTQAQRIEAPHTVL